jgi:hypothetical protein
MITSTNSDRPLKPSRLVRAYFGMQAHRNRLVRLIHATFTGFWLGILSRADLDSVDDAYYVGDQQSSIDYSNTEYNERGLFEWERAVIETHFPDSGSIGLMAAGGGREVLALRQLSFHVDAWECQPELVAAANELLVEAGFKPSVRYAPRDSIPTGTTTYDALIIGWGAYMLIPGSKRRIALLRELRTRVQEGSPILLSFFTRRPGDRYVYIAAGFANIARRLLRRERVEAGDWLEPNFVHYFIEDELASELTAGGFELKSFTVAPYGHAIAIASGSGGHSRSDNSRN